MKDALEEIDINEEEKNNENKKNLDNPELDDYEFLKPLSNQNKLRSFVDRYFLKYYKIYDESKALHQYAFLHTNK